jgi:hypothetical protein
MASIAFAKAVEEVLRYEVEGRRVEQARIPGFTALPERFTLRGTVKRGCARRAAMELAK